MLLGIAIGCCHNFGLSRIESLRFLKQFEIEAVELTFAFPQELLDFKPTREDIAFLRSKKYVSLHAPFKDAEYKNNEKTKEVFSALNSLALKVGAKNIVFHENNIKDFSIFNGVDFVPLVENLNFRTDAPRLFSVKHIKDFLEAHKGFGFCLDIGHSLKQEILPEDFLAVKEKILQLHVHFPRFKEGKIEPHGMAIKTEKKFLEQAKSVLSLKVPLLIEADLPQEKGEIEKEIELLRSLG